MLAHGKNRFGVSEVHDEIPTVHTLYDAVDDLALAIDKALIDRFALGVLHLLDDHLLGGLGGNTAESGGIHLQAQTVTEFTIVIELTPLFEGNLNIGVHHIGHHLFELKHLNFTGFFVILNLDVGVLAQLFSGCRGKGLFQRLDQHIKIDSLVFADLLDNPFDL